MRPSYNSSKDFELKLGINIKGFYRYQYNIIQQWAKMLGENPLKNVDFSLSIGTKKVRRSSEVSKRGRFVAYFVDS